MHNARESSAEEGKADVLSDHGSERRRVVGTGGVAHGEYRWVYRWHWTIRAMHRLAALSLLVLIVTGSYIGRPGTRIEIDGPDLPRRLTAKLSPHQVDVGELLALSALREQEPAVLVAFGVQPECVALGVGLSAPVSSALDGLVADAGARLRSWGHLGSVDTACTAVVGRS